MEQPVSALPQERLADISLDTPTVPTRGNKLHSATNKSQFFVQVAGLAENSFAVLEYQCSNYAISQHYTFYISVLSEQIIAASDIIGKAIKLITLQGDKKRNIHGIITGTQHLQSLLHGEEYIVVFESPLAVLKHFNHSRVFINKDIKKITKEVLLGAGLIAADFKFKTRFHYQQHEFIVQYDESDLDFLNRMLAYHGIYYCFESTAKKTVITFYDNINSLKTIKGEATLDYIEETGTVATKESISVMQQHTQLLSQHNILKDYNYNTPEIDLENSQKNNSATPSSGRVYHYGDNYLTLDAGEQQSRIHQQTIDWQRDTYIIKTDCRSVTPGAKITVNRHPNDSRNGEYLIVAVLGMWANQRSAQLIHNGNKPPNVAEHSKTFYAQIKVIKAGVIYRTPQLTRPMVHGSFMALIESSGGEYAYLDEQGRYRIRLDFDTGKASKAQASPPVRMAQAYTGEDYGIHFPLHAQTEVLVSCINGDINRPIILGAVANPDNHNPVTTKNKSQNILRTWGGNELLMEDKLQAEKIALFTRDKNNLLSLDATKDKHKIRLATEQGKMELRANQSMKTEAQDSIFVDCGKDHQITVENKHRLMTKNKAISQTAKTEIIKTAEHSVNWSSETENIELTVGNDMLIEVEQNCNFEVKNKDMSFTVTAGRFEIEAAKAITIIGQGGGAISMEQAGAKIVIDDSGVINIEGNSVSIDGNSIKIKAGNFNHLSGSGASSGGQGSNGNTGSSSLQQTSIAAYQAFIQAKIANKEIDNSISDAQSENLASDSNSPKKVNPVIAAARKKANSPQIPTLTWSDKRFYPNTTVHQIFSIKNVAAGSLAIITVFECDANGVQTTIDTIEIALDKGAGNYQNPWTRSSSSAEADLDSDNLADETGPLEYKFRVSVNGVQSKDSKTLLMPTSYEVIIKNGKSKNARIIANEAFVAKANGKQIGQGTTSERGGIVLRCVDPNATYTVEILEHVLTVKPNELKS